MNVAVPDYKDTLNLPKTSFPMKANLTQREPEILNRWEQIDLYRLMRTSAAGRTKYVLHDGPPYANGDLHAGHVLNKVLKDFVVKSKQMSGFDAPYVPGWDCHGLPIEHKVADLLGDQAKTMSQVEIRRRCREFALSFVDKHRAGFKRLGVTGEWQEPYLTLKPAYVATIIRVFAEMYEKGLIYKGLKPISWCPSDETALAEAEIEYANHVSPSVYVKFPLIDAVPGVSEPSSLVIWTTTPWTLPANLAIAVHPDHEYSAVKVGDDILVLASYLASTALQACGITDYKVLKRFRGSELEGLKYRHVMFPDRICPVLLGDHVTMDTGTGCVHTAPGHGQEDYVLGARHGIEPFAPVDRKGVFTNEAGPYAGLNVFNANARIVDDLKASGALLHSEKYEHSYPHCWRCGGPLIFRATPQWFVSMEQNDLRANVLEGIRAVEWLPKWGEDRIYGMVEQRPDWCISRQRAWGVPIPVFYGKQSGEVYATPESFARIEQLALSAEDGIDRWFDTPAQELLPPGAKCPKTGDTEFVKETDILDVWFDSGVSNRAVCEVHSDLHWPAEMYLEGSDQHRGWFQSSIIPAVAVKGEPPFRTVLTTGYVVDGEGKKMSKKLGNYFSLDDLVAQYGADVSRLWVASENYRQDIRISQEILTRQQDTYRRIRNTFRYILGNLGDFTPEQQLPYDQLEPIDRWALHQTQVLKQRVLQAYAAFEFHQVYHAIHNFCAVDMSAFYLDVLKDRLYTYSAQSVQRRSSQTAMAEVLVDLLKLLAPILVFTCDEAWQYLPEHLRTSQSVHLEQFTDVREAYLLAAETVADWDEILRIRAVVSKELEEARRAEMIGSSLQAAVTLSPGNARVADLLERFLPQLEDLFIVSKCTVTAIDAAAAPVEAGVVATVDAAPGNKCMRCWHVRESVGSVSGHPQICHVCANQLGVNA